MPPLQPIEASCLATVLLRKCAAATSLREARQLHALLTTSTHYHRVSPFLHNNILSMYGRCGSLEDSQLLFDKMPHRNIISYNALISAYSRSPQQAHRAFCLFHELENGNLVANDSTFTSLLHALSGPGNEVLGSLLHNCCVKRGFCNNLLVQTSLLGMYSDLGYMDCAKKVFSLMTDKDTTAWNAVISGCVKNGKIMEGLEIFKNMLKDEGTPSQFTYSLVLKACAILGNHVVGKLMHAKVLVSETYVDLPLQNVLLHMYCSCGDINALFKVFSRIANPDLVSWNSIIGGFSESGDGDMTMFMFVKLGRLSRVKPDEYTFATVISGTGVYPASRCGEPLHAQIEKAGFARSLYIGSALISMYFSNDDGKSSQKIFNVIPNKDVVLWTDMIRGNGRIGESEISLQFFRGLCHEGLKLDSFALSSALSACADQATLRQGEMVHSLALKTGSDTETCVNGSLVNMYVKIGELKAAECVFSCLPDRDLKCWNSMLGGYGHHGKAKEAFQLFEEILKHDLRPDHVTFISLLATCGHCGLVNESWFFWNYMKESGLTPGPKHFSCMISLLSRVGLMEEAEKLIDESPFADEYLELWRTILCFSIESRNLRGGVRAAEQILALNPEDIAANILLTKLYAAAGRWDDVSKIRRNVREVVSDKEPGLSWIEISNNVHIFSSGDETHLQNNEIQLELRKLLGNLMPIENKVDTVDLISTSYTCQVTCLYQL
ncbi:pentatricopeptide repeat-containing protein-like [Dorcoceras hygrometricum]|uniref:Pentatricopeptide repeat-containing protein-like n=1 Tax=Dorcoceras hygrometricum TaxID=472368 RepID=A0A2Z7ASU4_9LAMI|nr:pentatricopeptide repeat-containing protein-like [Dorcoceras hygrometricum]